MLIVICGPTASGKSGLALTIAQRLGTVILTADSRQVYRGFDIGTAKPSRAEQLRLPHYLIDICEPTETLTLGDYQDLAGPLIGAQLDRAKAQARPAPPLLVGGTGLYIKSIVRGMVMPRVAPQVALRQDLAARGQAACYDELLAVDPLAASRIHANDEVRTLRALEVYRVTGRPISEQQGEAPPDYPILQIGLDCLGVDGPGRGDPEGDRLLVRIRQRTEQMVQMGWVDEVEDLRRQYGRDLPLLSTLGYGEIGQYLEGKWTLAEAIEATVLHTRQFAKRQRTWFRGIDEIEWFDSEAIDLVDRVWARIGRFLDDYWVG
jgi:tRNA dimethylallyltransferase